MIQARPVDFIEPNLESYLSDEVRKSDLTQLQPGPVLFHSGYLTLDKTLITEVTEPATGKKRLEERYAFRFPNFEVSSSYRRDCFKTVFGLKSDDALNAEGAKLRRAILSRDAGTVAEVLGGFISSITYHQRPGDEKTFHAVVQMILMAMGFKVRSERLGFKGRLDLLVELPNKVHAIIELKYCPSAKKKLTKDEEDNLLANWAISDLAPELVDRALSKAMREKLPFEDIDRILSDAAVNITDYSRRDAALASGAREFLTVDEMKTALADAARANLNGDEMKDILFKATTRTDLSAEKIDDLLSKAARNALSDIIKRKYRDMVDPGAEEIIDLGLAIYGGDGRVKAIFGCGRVKPPL
jgi:hypothetical protein